MKHEAPEAHEEVVLKGRRLDGVTLRSPHEIDQRHGGQLGHGAFVGLRVGVLEIPHLPELSDVALHPVGDEVIKRIAAIGESSLRNRDIMGRIGGEEFLCVLPRATTEQSLQVAQRLLTAISEEKFTTADGRSFSTSISIGIANFDTSIANADQLYTRADEAMYESKAAGKGRITAYRAH